jgi:hypothetical protein
MMIYLDLCIAKQYGSPAYISSIIDIKLGPNRFSIVQPLDRLLQCAYSQVPISLSNISKNEVERYNLRPTYCGQGYRINLTLSRRGASSFYQRLGVFLRLSYKYIMG